MKRTLLTISLVTAGLCMVFSAKKEINDRLEHSVAVNFNKAETKLTADTTKRKTTLYKSSDLEDGTTMRARTGTGKNGKSEMVYTFKREGVLYQVFTNGGRAAELYINGKEQPVSAHKAKIDQLMDEYREIAATPLPPIPAVAPVAPLSAPVMLAYAPQALPAAPIVPVADLGAIAPVPSIPPMPRIAQMAPLAKIQALPVMPALPPVPPVAPDSLSKEIMDALIKQGAIKDRDNYDVHITNKVLIIDGIKQSNELHKQVIDKMTKKPGDKVNWNFSRHN